jgi:hypothetical protein
VWIYFIVLMLVRSEVASLLISTSSASTARTACSFSGILDIVCCDLCLIWANVYEEKAQQATQKDNLIMTMTNSTKSNQAPALQQ